MSTANASMKKLSSGLTGTKTTSNPILEADNNSGSYVGHYKKVLNYQDNGSVFNYSVDDAMFMVGAFNANSMNAAGNVKLSIPFISGRSFPNYMHYILMSGFPGTVPSSNAGKYVDLNLITAEDPFNQSAAETQEKLKTLRSGLEKIQARKIDADSDAKDASDDVEDATKVYNEAKQKAENKSNEYATACKNTEDARVIYDGLLSELDILKTEQEKQISGDAVGGTDGQKSVSGDGGVDASAGENTNEQIDYETAISKKQSEIDKAKSVYEELKEKENAIKEELNALNADMESAKKDLDIKTETLNSANKKLEELRVKVRNDSIAILDIEIGFGKGNLSYAEQAIIDANDKIKSTTAAYEAAKSNSLLSDEEVMTKQESVLVAKTELIAANKLKEESQKYVDEKQAELKKLTDEKEMEEKLKQTAAEGFIRQGSYRSRMQSIKDMKKITARERFIERASRNSASANKISRKFLHKENYTLKEALKEAAEEKATAENETTTNAKGGTTKTESATLSNAIDFADLKPNIGADATNAAKYIEGTIFSDILNLIKNEHLIADIDMTNASPEGADTVTLPNGKFSELCVKAEGNESARIYKAFSRRKELEIDSKAKATYVIAFIMEQFNALIHWCICNEIIDSTKKLDEKGNLTKEESDGFKRMVCATFANPNNGKMYDAFVYTLLAPAIIQRVYLSTGSTSGTTASEKNYDQMYNLFKYMGYLPRNASLVMNTGEVSGIGNAKTGKSVGVAPVVDALGLDTYNLAVNSDLFNKIGFKDDGSMNTRLTDADKEPIDKNDKTNIKFSSNVYFLPPSEFMVWMLTQPRSLNKIITDIRHVVKSMPLLILLNRAYRHGMNLELEKIDKKVKYSEPVLGYPVIIPDQPFLLKHKFYYPEHLMYYVNHDFDSTQRFNNVIAYYNTNMNTGNDYLDLYAKGNAISAGEDNVYVSIPTVGKDVYTILKDQPGDVKIVMNGNEWVKEYAAGRAKATLVASSTENSKPGYDLLQTVPTTTYSIKKFKDPVISGNALHYRVEFNSMDAVNYIHLSKLLPGSEANYYATKKENAQYPLAKMLDIAYMVESSTAFCIDILANRDSTSE